MAEKKKTEKAEAKKAKKSVPSEAKPKREAKKPSPQKKTSLATALPQQMKEQSVAAEKRASKVEHCEDKHCAVHKHMSIRGRVFTGTVIKDKMMKTVIVEWPRRELIRKYDRYMKKRSRVVAHNPKCLNARIGDKVRIAECRKISKTKSFVVLEVLP